MCTKSATGERGGVYMYQNMYIHIYIYTHTYIYIYTHTYLYIFMYVHMYIHVYISVQNLQQVKEVVRRAANKAALSRFKSATHCNELQHTATHGKQSGALESRDICVHHLQQVKEVVRRASNKAALLNLETHEGNTPLHFAAIARECACLCICVCVRVCCRVLQFIAMCCRVLPCVAACCSMLQCVAVSSCMCRVRSVCQM